MLVHYGSVCAAILDIDIIFIKYCMYHFNKIFEIYLRLVNYFPRGGSFSFRLLRGAITHIGFFFITQLFFILLDRPVRDWDWH